MPPSRRVRQLQAPGRDRRRPDRCEAAPSAAELWRRGDVIGRAAHHGAGLRRGHRRLHYGRARASRRRVELSTSVTTVTPHLTQRGAGGEQRRTLCGRSVLVGTGVGPEDSLAAAAGSPCRTASSSMRSAAPPTADFCCRRPHALPGARRRRALENWKHAQDHGRSLAATPQAQAQLTTRCRRSGPSYDLYVQGHRLARSFGAARRRNCRAKASCCSK